MECETVLSLFLLDLPELVQSGAHKLARERYVELYGHAMEVIYHTDRGAVFPPLCHMFVVF